MWTCRRGRRTTTSHALCSTRAGGGGLMVGTPFVPTPADHRGTARLSRSAAASAVAPWREALTTRKGAKRRAGPRYSLSAAARRPRFLGATSSRPCLNIERRRVLQAKNSVSARREDANFAPNLPPAPHWRANQLIRRQWPWGSRHGVSAGLWRRADSARRNARVERAPL